MENKMVASKFAVKGKVKTIKGSILNPEIGGLRFILNPVATNGEAKSELELQLDTRWKKVRAETKSWFVNKTGAYKLGALNTIAVQSDIWIINMLCKDNDFNYSEQGVATCLKELAKMAKSEKASVHVSSKLIKDMPKLPTLLEDFVINSGVSVYYYNE